MLATSREGIKKEETAPDCPATISHELGTTLPSRALYPAGLSSAAMIHHGPPASGTFISRYNSPWTTGQSATHPATYCGSWLTGRLLITRQPCSPTTANIAREGPVTYTTNLGKWHTIHTTATVQLWDVHKCCYMCFTVGVITNNPTVSHKCLKSREKQ